MIEKQVIIDKILEGLEHYDKKKWCGYGGHFTVPDPVTNRCKEHGFKVRKYARATNCTGRQKRRDTVARY